MSNQYWLEQPTISWDSTEQLKTQKSDLQQIPYNLSSEESKEKQVKEVSLFPMMVRSTAHQKDNELHRRWRLKVKIWGEDKKYILNVIIFKNMKKYNTILTLKPLILELINKCVDAKLLKFNILLL